MVKKYITSIKGNITFSNKVSSQKQLRHIKGFAPVGKSYLDSIDDAQKVLDLYNNGDYRLISANFSKSTVTIEVDGVTGIYVNTGNPNGLPDITVPTNKFMIQSVKSPKIVPVNPNK